MFCLLGARSWSAVDDPNIEMFATHPSNKRTVFMDATALMFDS